MMVIMLLATGFFIGSCKKGEPDKVAAKDSVIVPTEFYIGFCANDCADCSMPVSDSEAKVYVWRFPADSLVYELVTTAYNRRDSKDTFRISFINGTPSSWGDQLFGELEISHDSLQMSGYRPPGKWGAKIFSFRGKRQ